MADFKQLMSEEVRRLARKEVRAALAPMAETIAALKHQVAAQRKQIAALAKSMPTPAEKAEPLAASIAKPSDKKVRINAAGIIRLRGKLGVTQAELAKLLNVAMHTVSVWEQGRRIPRGAHKAQLAALRGIGKREIRRLLADAKKAEAKPETAEVEAAK